MLWPLWRFFQESFNDLGVSSKLKEMVVEVQSGSPPASPQVHPVQPEQQQQPPSATSISDVQSSVEQSLSGPDTSLVQEQHQSDSAGPQTSSNSPEHQEPPKMKSDPAISKTSSEPSTSKKIPGIPSNSGPSDFSPKPQVSKPSAVAPKDELAAAPGSGPAGHNKFVKVEAAVDTESRVQLEVAPTSASAPAGQQQSSSATEATHS